MRELRHPIDYSIDTGVVINIQWDEFDNNIVQPPVRNPAAIQRPFPTLQVHNDKR
jgi:hypothetical protein